eukprot:127937-Hanusia_phi.AAC.5
MKLLGSTSCDQWSNTSCLPSCTAFYLQSSFSNPTRIKRPLWSSSNREFMRSSNKQEGCLGHQPNGIGLVSLSSLEGLLGGQLLDDSVDHIEDSGFASLGGGRSVRWRGRF